MAINDFFGGFGNFGMGSGGGGGYYGGGNPYFNNGASYLGDGLNASLGTGGGGGGATYLGDPRNILTQGGGNTVATGGTTVAAGGGPRKGDIAVIDDIAVDDVIQDDTPIIPAGAYDYGSGKVYSAFTTEDIVEGGTKRVTRGLWSGNSGELTVFHTSSYQSNTQKQYYYEIYNGDPTVSTNEPQFSVAYGHYAGSGSLGTKGATGDRTTAAIFGQFNSLINPAQTTAFTFQDNTTAKQFYGIVLNRARMRDGVEPGGWEIHLSGSSANTHLKLIDDSSVNNGGNDVARNFAPEYNVVSGSLIGGTTIKTAASAEGSAGSYGTFYPSLGVIILNAERLAGAGLRLATASGSNSDDRNAKKLWKAIDNGGYFQMKRKEEITSTHYFVRATSGKFNSTTNETFYTQSVAGTKQVIAGLASEPKTFITTVGCLLYTSPSPRDRQKSRMPSSA